ncbi:2OG-Fe(II) oxygenase family protein [Gammaproteobacteria bacterium]|nr:2OG-Fe(II) oxygenase family protein [Gammaproteobacteria bacterium]
MLARTNEQHASIKQDLLDLFYAHRDEHSKTIGPVYASRDNLYELYKDHPAFAALIKFILDSVYQVAAHANGKAWQNSQSIDVKLTGVWFQISNDNGLHETHIHGNCSWSGVYYVQAGESSRSKSDRRNGLLNGVTRFYGPYMEFLAGGHSEFGNLYLGHGSWDSFPQDGKIAVFPSYLKHMVFPYSGEQDRVIISFHAQVDGEKELQYRYQFD